MKLYFLNEFLGDIHNINVDGMWTNGEITPSKSIDKFNDFFVAIVDEENDFEETNYRDEWLDDNNWYIIDNENEKKGIYIPAVYPDGEISWRWRWFIFKAFIILRNINKPWLAKCLSRSLYFWELSTAE